jgi:hypothetical protein
VTTKKIFRSRRAVLAAWITFEVAGAVLFVYMMLHMKGPSCG